jgi:hypothetical protein
MASPTPASPILPMEISKVQSSYSNYRMHFKNNHNWYVIYNAFEQNHKKIKKSHNAFEQVPPYKFRGIVGGIVDRNVDA